MHAPEERWVLLSGGEQRCRLSHARKAQTFGGGLLPQQELGQFHPCAQGPSSAVHCTHPCPEDFPAVSSVEGLFQSECGVSTSSKQTSCATSSHCCLPSCWCQSSWMPLRRRAAASSGGPWWPHWKNSVVQMPGGAFKDLSSFVGELEVQRTNRHHMHKYFLKVLPLCISYSKRYHPDCAPKHRLVPLSGVKRLSCPQCSPPYCVWL